jgi:hypothetical protein
LMRERGAANIQLLSSSDLTSFCSASITSDRSSAGVTSQPDYSTD